MMKLNLNLLAGDIELSGPAQIQATPRASSQQVLETPRSRLVSAKETPQCFTAGPEHHGLGPVLVAASLGLVASVGMTGILHMWRGDGQHVGLSNLFTKAATPRPPTWLQFDSTGEVLGALVTGVGLWLLYRPSSDGKAVVFELEGADGSARITWAAWSATQPELLAVGTDGGRVSLYSKQTKKLVAQASGKHPGRGHRISCGEWLGNGMLALASRERLKVSKPISAECPEWASFSKFYLTKMVSKIPVSQVHADKTPYDATPQQVTVSGGEHKLIAMGLGGKVVTLMDYTGSYEEEGFFVPVDYGDITTMTWLPRQRLLVGLTNGYIVSVNALLLLQQRRNSSVAKPGADVPSAATAMRTTRVFTSYLTAAARIGPHAAVVGDGCVKVLQVDPNPSEEYTDLLVVMEVSIAGFVPRPGVALVQIVCAPADARRPLPLWEASGRASTDGRDSTSGLEERGPLVPRQWHLIVASSGGHAHGLTVDAKFLEPERLLAI